MAHGHQTNSQDHLPAIGQNLADKANRLGVTERLADPAVHKSSEVDLALLTDDDPRLTELERSLVKHATHPDAKTFDRLRSVPGVGKMLALVLLYAWHDSHRFPRGQDVVSYARLLTSARESAGQRYGTSGKNIGHADLTWAFSAAAVLFLRHHPAGPKCLAP